jgi:hypothetical protein
MRRENERVCLVGTGSGAAKHHAVMPAHAGHPVRGGLPENHDRLWNAGSPAFAEDDNDVRIARSVSDEAIQTCCLALDCFAPLAMTETYQYPSAQPSLRGSEPPVSVPLSQSMQIAWPPPSGATSLVVL